MVREKTAVIIHESDGTGKLQNGPVAEMEREVAQLAARLTRPAAADGDIPAGISRIEPLNGRRRRGVGTDLY
jgi:hypothetical protein